MQQNRQGGWMQITHWIRQLKGFSLFSLMFANCTKQAWTKGKFEKSNWFHSSSISLVNLHKHLCFCKIQMQFQCRIFFRILNSFKFNIQHYIQTEYLNKLKMFWIFKWTQIPLNTELSSFSKSFYIVLIRKHHSG